MLGLALAGGAGVMLKSSPAPAVAGTAPAPTSDVALAPEIYGSGMAAAPPAVAPSATDPLLQALKDELFELETDRLAGRLSETQYAEHKAALDLVLRRALGRVDPVQHASTT